MTVAQSRTKKPAASQRRHTVRPLLKSSAEYRRKRRVKLDDVVPQDVCHGMIMESSMECSLVLKLRAEVRAQTGGTIHLVGGVESSVPASVDLVAENGGVFLLRLDAHGVCLADTWHQTVAEAKDQARHEYRIEDTDWVEA